ncbi:MAG TPA: hypothetical protein VK526_00430, partial [Bradyrhizobium sp.]|nr:hypothetical protein [Bradyrhizobium sp.]
MAPMTHFRREVPKREQRGIDPELRLAKVELLPHPPKLSLCMEFTLTRASSSHRLEPLRHVDAGVLNIAYYEAGPADGPVVMLLHGFPFDI